MSKFQRVGDRSARFLLNERCLFFWRERSLSAFRAAGNASIMTEAAGYLPYH
jgi:hypothetical protein